MKQKVTVILSIVLIFLCGCNNNQSQTTSVQTANSTITVYITKTGECYHQATCQCLSQSKIAKDLEHASKHYRPCQICCPPGID